MADLTRLYDFTPGTLIRSSEIDAEYNQLIARVNNLPADGIADDVFAAYRTILAVMTHADSSLVSGTVYLASSHRVPTGEEPRVAHGSEIHENALPWLFNWVAADYAVAGRTTKLRLRAQLIQDATAPSVTVTCGLHPINDPSANNWNFLGAVAGSTATLANPPGNSRNTANSGDFAPPADGYYGLGFTLSGAPASPADSVIAMQLQQRWT